VRLLAEEFTMINSNTSRVPLFSLLIVSVLAISCGGSDIPQSGGSAVQFEPPSITNQSDDTETDEALFPTAITVIDPASTREELAQRADTLLVEYRTLMSQVLPQMNEVYQQISSGVPSSSESSIVASDVEFVNAINNSCDPQINDNGTMTGLLDCNDLSAQFALRHSRYNNVQILVTDYYPLANFNRGDETGIYIASGRYSLVDDSFIREDIVRIATGKYAVSTDERLDIPILIVINPAFSIDRQLCLVYLSPTRFPEDRLEVNQCSEILRNMITVLQRLNDNES